MTPLAPVGLLALFLGAGQPTVESLVVDVQRIAKADTNEGRFEALTAMLRARNLTFAIESFTLEKALGREPRTEGRNVIVTLGDGPEEIVVGAHYDAARLPDGSLSRGAVDNAASSVVLVHLAEALRGEKFSRRVKVVWFDMEELGLVGSARYVKGHPSDRPSAMLNFDVNGYGDTVVFGPSEQEQSAGLKQALIQTCASEARACVAFPQMPPGDDRSFTNAGTPTLSIATLPASEAHQLWLMMNAKQDSGLAQGHVPEILRTIHTPEDTAERIDGTSMQRTLRFALALVRTLAVR